jgi:antitoxin VapB
MSLNIKNAETVRLARELARETGESLTDAVTESVRERLERVRSGPDGAIADRLLQIGADCARRLPKEVLEVDHGQVLYGDDGLPR